MVIFLIIDSFKVLFLFPLHIPNKYQEHASYVNTDKRNIIHTSIQTQRIKLKEVSVSRKFTEEKEYQNLLKRNSK